MWVAQTISLTEGGLQILKMNKNSVLFITLDSCRYDAFVEASTPNLKSVGPLHCAHAPGNFTYGSHCAMFVGFTPGISSIAAPYVNPKFGKIFKMNSAAFRGRSPSHINLFGRNIIDGFNLLGYQTVGTGAVSWFDPHTATGKALTQDFQHYYYPGSFFQLKDQVSFALEKIKESSKPSFCFVNVGETHVPYFHAGADWQQSHNPCRPFEEQENDADECRRRQIACVEYVDREIALLLHAFQDCTIVICADHGDCWGEDGIWEHGISHEKVLEVPLIFSLSENCAISEDQAIALSGDQSSTTAKADVKRVNIVTLIKESLFRK